MNPVTPTTWGPAVPDYPPNEQAPPIKIRVMRWRKGHFEIEWANGERFTRMGDG